MLIVRIASRTYLTLICFCAITMQLPAQLIDSPLSSGQWAKFSVEKNGVYKIDYTLLKESGLNVDNLDPRNIRIFGNGSGMLPQANSSDRIGHLTELAITVEGEADGVFDQGDFIMFYGEGPDNYYYDLQKEIFNYENHLYSDKNFYFLTFSSQPGKRMANTENIEGVYPIINTYNDFIFHELENHNELKSGRQWFGEKFDVTTSLSLKFDKPGITPNSSMKIISGVMSQNFNPASFNLSLNGVNILDQPIDPIANTQYGIKGRLVIDTVVSNANTLNAPSNVTQDFTYRYTKGSSGRSIGYLDFILVSLERNLEANEEQVAFRSSSSLLNLISTFEINSVADQTSIWNVTDPFNASVQLFQKNNNKLSFSTSTNELKNFLVFGANPLIPKFEKTVPNQNLRNGSSPELLIVTHPDLRAEANRLAAHRQSFNGISSLVVTQEEVFNEFSGGKQDPTAIRDFSLHLFGKGLKHLLLFGRGSYDFKDRVNKNTNLVPTYESRNSLSPLETYSSDDYFGFLELSEGEWQENPATNHTLDIGVGRLPVKSAEEASTVVDKLIGYDTNSKSFGPWRKEIVFVADDGDFNIHQGDADQLARDIEAGQAQFDTKKIYLDAFRQISRPSGQISPDARKALLKKLNQGALIINFTGHGSERVWVQEQILDVELLEEWNNPIVFPLMVTATCEFGRHDDPAQISSSELSLIKKNGGPIGYVTASRPVNAASNAFLNGAFYDALMVKENGKYRDLGTVFKDTKNNSLNGVANRNFSLLGDPSMKLAIPDNEVVATKITTALGSDTLKALSRILIEGEIQTGGIKNTAFNGSVRVMLKDKEFSFKTLGDENPVFTYKERSNTLFNGEATVANGEFQIEFILPKNIAYQVGAGKLSLYAKTANNTQDAMGGTIEFNIGESEVDDGSDKTPPEIKLFIGDTTFINGGIASPSTSLVARLSDKSGINIPNYGIGNNLIGILDGDQTFELGEYYLADIDDFTRGTITFPLENLAPGKHTIEVRAWDVYNNGTSESIHFVVTGDNQLTIEQLINYPNPFSEITNFQFTHNRTGEELEVYVMVFDLSGKPMSSMYYEIENSQYMVTLPEWDGTNTTGTKLGNGIYLLRVEVRSQLDGSKNERISKLIILN